MFELQVSETFDAAHFLVGYAGKCSQLHGHTWKVAVKLRGCELDRVGMVFDFSKAKKFLREILNDFDHHCLNELEYFQTMKKNPTAENLAEYIFDCYAKKIEGEKIKLQEVCVWEAKNSCVTFWK